MNYLQYLENKEMQPQQIALIVMIVIFALLGILFSWFSWKAKQAQDDDRAIATHHYTKGSLKYYFRYHKFAFIFYITLVFWILVFVAIVLLANGEVPRRSPTYLFIL